jgi:ribonuclease Z
MTDDVQVVLLGTGSPLPDPNRAGPATLVRAAGTDLLVDCGRGVLMRLAGAGVLPMTLGALLLTHQHSDHVTDLNDVITTRWAMSMVPNPLRIVGPVGTTDLVDRTMAMLETDIGYRMAHHEDLVMPPECVITEVGDGEVDLGPNLRVLAAPTDHAPVDPTVGYRIEVGDKAVVLAGDTVPCDGLDRLCARADVYVQTVIRPDLIANIPAPRIQDILDYHSSVRDAAETAARAGVGTLVLTHLVPAPMPGTEQGWIDLAAEVFDGEIVVGADLQVITA